MVGRVVGRITTRLAVGGLAATLLRKLHASYDPLLSVTGDFEIVP